MMYISKITLFYNDLFNSLYPQENCIKQLIYHTVNNMIIIHIKAFPDAKKESFAEITPHKFRVFVREPAQNNQANRRITTLLSEHYSIPLGQVRIISGHHGNNKTIEIHT